jgi:hypothetical protein
MAKSDPIVPLLGLVGGIPQSINKTIFYIIPGVWVPKKALVIGLQVVYCVCKSIENLRELD